MNGTLLYVYSKQKHFLDFLSIMVENIDITTKQFTTSKALYKSCTDELPHILLLERGAEDDTAEIYAILSNFTEKYKKTLTSIILLSAHQKREDRVDAILKGVDYYLEQPINMVELVAYISAIDRYKKRLSSIIAYERSLSIIDTMNTVSHYLEKNVREQIQMFVDYPLSSTPTEEELNKYVSLSRLGAGKVIAAVNAVKDELQQLIQVSDPSRHIHELDSYLEKHLLLVKAAYHLETTQNITERSMQDE